MARILVTGGAGFIGSHVVDALVAMRHRVLCLDDFNDFYDPTEKRRNVAPHLNNPFFSLAEGDIRDVRFVQAVVGEWRPEIIIHLAARAGVRPSVREPGLYAAVNVQGTLNVLEAARLAGVRKVIFGSSSSVYGLNAKIPFGENDPLLKPASPYGATKIAGEALCHAYAHLYGIRVVCLRFFTVYGPRQRPDLAIRRFAERMLRGEPITLFGDGTGARDYTFITDIVSGVLAALDYEGSVYEVFNLGNSKPVRLTDLVAALEGALGIRATIQWTEEQPGDIPITYADISKAVRVLGYRPTTSLERGLETFVSWLRQKDGQYGVS